MEEIKLFNYLKVKNIYLKSVRYDDYNNSEDLERVTVSKNINIISRDGKDASFIVEHKFLTNKGSKSEIAIDVCIEIEIDIVDNDSDDVNDRLENIAQKIVKVNYVDEKVSLLVGNITSSFGDEPLLMPNDGYVRQKKK
jgi:hypothetical protein